MAVKFFSIVNCPSGQVGRKQCSVDACNSRAVRCNERGSANTFYLNIKRIHKPEQRSMAWPSKVSRALISEVTAEAEAEVVSLHRAPRYRTESAAAITVCTYTTVIRGFFHLLG
ncbi:hypothetical protein J6590_043802 [Homalodisca vitripennis]|nr:hypothetical protein J6590_043802 [Homalodisca vitripennis]